MQPYAPANHFAAGYALHNANAERSPTLITGETAYTLSELIHMEKFVMEEVFDTAPASYDDMKLFLGLTPMSSPSRVMSWTEHGFGRQVGVINANSAILNAASATQGTRVYTLTAASVGTFVPDRLCIFPNNQQGIVVSVAGNDITVRSMTNQGLPAAVAGDWIADGGFVGADGMDRFSGVDRLATITRYNYFEKIGPRAVRWDRIERQERINMGRTNYMQADDKERLRQLRTDIQQRFWLGIRGEGSLSQGEPLLKMHGVTGFMDSFGSATTTVPLAGLPDAFESLGIATNHLKEGSTRFICCHPKLALALSKHYKLTGTRYTPNDQIAKLDLKSYEIAGQNYVIVPCPNFGEASIFPRAMVNRMYVLDFNNIKPCRMDGIPMLEMGKTTNNREQGDVRDYTITYCQAYLSLWFKQVQGSFYIDVI